MNAYRLSAAGGALALHGVVLTGVLSLALAPPAHREIEPVQVLLVTPPEPLPVAPATPQPEPATPQPEPAPRPAEPTPRVRAPAPLPPAPRAPGLARPAPAKPVPRPVARASPPPPIAAPEPTAQAITLPPASAPSEAPLPSTPPATGQPAPAPSAAVAPARNDATQAATTTRNPPRVDASWSGNTPPPYPGLARRMGDQGEVRLDVRVDVDGKVTEIRLKQSSGSALLDRTAVDTVKKWRFKPATVDGQPVAEWYHDWRWVFRLES